MEKRWREFRELAQEIIRGWDVEQTLILVGLGIAFLILSWLYKLSTLLYFLLVVILPTIGWVGIVSWHIRDRESWLAMLATIIYSGALILLLVTVIAVEAFQYHDN